MVEDEIACIFMIAYNGLAMPFGVKKADIQPFMFTAS
jgi:hypothetical protein